MANNIEQVQASVMDIIAHKKRLEAFYEASREDWLFQQITKLSMHHIDYKDAQVAFNPVHFISKCLPFIDIKDPESKTRGLQKIAAEYVLGSQHTQYPIEHDPGRPWVKEAFDRLKQINIEAKEKPNQTLYYHIGHLPLFIAAEGKNRVSLAQSIRGSLYGRVIDIPFPKPGTLTIHEIRPFNLVVIKCNDEHFHTDPELTLFGGQILPYPEVYLPLLLAYGAEYGKSYFAPWAIWHYLKARRKVIAKLDSQLGH